MSRIDKKQNLEDTVCKIGGRKTGGTLDTAAGDPTPDETVFAISSLYNHNWEEEE